MTSQDNYDQDSPVFSTWEDLDKQVKANGGVLRVAMWALRDIDGYGRLGVRVLTTIHNQLVNIGIGHLPFDLPNNQHQNVVLYKLASEAGAVVEAVRSGASTFDAEAALRLLNTSDKVQEDKAKDAKLEELADKIEKLEELVGDFRAVIDGK